MLIVSPAIVVACVLTTRTSSLRTLLSYRPPNYRAAEKADCGREVDEDRDLLRYVEAGKVGCGCGIVTSTADVAFPTLPGTAHIANTVIAEADDYKTVEGSIYFPPSSINDKSLLESSSMTNNCP